MYIHLFHEIDAFMYARACLRIHTIYNYLLTVVKRALHFFKITFIDLEFKIHTIGN